ncbi:MAG: hypothetical protein KDB61_07880, partial [Planctomycetes bacterium]|nr:hypothetical protein [Planctomycetota bacterium]
TDLGHPDAIGKPLEFTWSGGEVDWQDPILPEPHVGEVKEEYLPEYTYNYHTGTIVAWFVGTPKGAKIEDLRLSISGQTCSHKTGSCVLFNASDLSAKASDTIWGSAPASMKVIQGGAGGAKPGSFGFSLDDISADMEGDVENAFGWVPEYDAHVDARCVVERAGTQVKATIEIDVEEGFHAYHGPTLDDIAPNKPVAAPTELSWNGAEVQWGKAVYSEPHESDGWSDAGEEIKVKTHDGAWTITVQGTVAEDADLSNLGAVLKGQVCDDMGCMNFELDLTADVTTVQAIEPAAALDGGGESKKDSEEGSIWALIGQAIFWGFITLLMPCTYPMIPITISFFTKQATNRGGSVLPLSLTYGAGIVVIFIGIGLLAAPVIIPFAQSPWTNMIIGAVFVYFSLTLFGVITLNPPQFMLRMAGQASMKGGLLGVFLMGATLVITSFTCTAPFVGTLLGSAAAGTTGGAGVVRIVIGMGVFGLVMAIPFVMLSLLPSRLQSMPQAGGWMNTIKVFMGFVELAAAFKFFSNADVVEGWGVLSRELFLIIWVVIFLAAAIYLILGAMRGDRGGLRIFSGLGTLAFALVLATYVPGKQGGFILNALLPDYSSPRILALVGGKGVVKAKHTIVEDDVLTAVALAQTEQKLLLLNFTGKS